MATQKMKLSVIVMLALSAAIQTRVLKASGRYQGLRPRPQRRRWLRYITMQFLNWIILGVCSWKWKKNYSILFIFKLNNFFPRIYWFDLWMWRPFSSIECDILKISDFISVDIRMLKLAGKWSACLLVVSTLVWRASGTDCSLDRRRNGD